MYRVQGAFRATWPVLLVCLATLLLSACGSRQTAEPLVLPETTGEAEVRKIWSQRVARGHDDEFLFLQPAVTNDTVYIVTAEGYLTAYNARNGRRDWWIKLDDRVLGGVGADEDQLYVVTRGGDLVALSLDGQEEYWRAPLPNESLVPPQSNGALVVTQTIDGQLLAFDRSSGERRWLFDTSMPVLSYRGNATPWMDDRRLVTGFDNGRVAALDVNSGRLLWNYDVGVPSGRTELERLVDIDGSPVVRNGRVYVTGYQGRMAALDLRTGDELWSRPGSSLRSPGVDDNRIIVAGSDGLMIGYDQRSRSEVWRVESLKRRELTDPVPLSGYFLVGDSEGYIFAIEPRDGSIASFDRVDEKGIRSSFVRYRDRIIMFGNGGQLASYRIVKP